ncbi:hypothetical protein BH23THE1_BH23THE1_00360 [soil metagenome]
MKADALDSAFRNEGDVRVAERLFLIIRILSNKQYVEPVALELHRSRAGAYKGYKRYNKEGLVDRIDKPRSGRQSFTCEWEIVKIMHELFSSNTGCDTKEVMKLV